MFGSASFGIILIGLGLFVCYEATQFSLGQPSRPGPGFFSFGLGAILTVLAILYLLPVFRKRVNDRPSRSGGNPLNTVLAIGVLCLYALLVNWLGYLITTFLMFAAWLTLIERKKWFVVLPLAGLAVVGVYFFNVIFSVQLPLGLLKGILR